MYGVKTGNLIICPCCLSTPSLSLQLAYLADLYPIIIVFKQFLYDGKRTHVNNKNQRADVLCMVQVLGLTGVKKRSGTVSLFLDAFFWMRSRIVALSYSGEQQTRFQQLQREIKCARTHVASRPWAVSYLCKHWHRANASHCE